LTQLSEHKSDNITVSVTKKPGTQVAFEIFVSPKATAAAYAKAVKSINKEVSLPGFRKGKAPEEFIVQNYGREIEAEWRELIIHTGFNEALQLIKEIHPFRRNEVKCSNIAKVSKEEGAQFTIEFEASPKVPQINLDEITLQDIPLPKVEEEDINDVVNDLRQRMASFEEVKENEPITEESYVSLDVEKLDEPKEILDEPKEMLCQDTLYTVHNMHNWMKNLILGKHVGDVVEGKSSLEESEQGDEAFTPIHCRITVKSLKKRVLPEVNDEFAKKVGAPSLEVLKKLIVNNLHEKAQENIQEQLRHQLDQIMLSKYDFDVPTSLVDDEVLDRLDSYKRTLEDRKIPEQEATKQLQEAEAELPEKVREQCKLFFIYIYFAGTKHLQVSPKEMQDEYPNMPIQEDLKARISQKILLRKARDFIISHVKKISNQLDPLS